VDVLEGFQKTIGTLTTGALESCDGCIVWGCCELKGKVLLGTIFLQFASSLLSIDDETAVCSAFQNLLTGCGRKRQRRFRSWRMSENSLAEHALDIRRINAVLQDALDAFRRSFVNNPFINVCSREASFIAWLAVFAPEALSDATKTLLRKTFDEAERIDEKHFSEIERLNLRIAIYGCTKDASWLQLHLDNLGHANFGVRDIIRESLLIVADDLFFFEPSLQGSIECSLQFRHRRRLDTVALAVVGRADRLSKILKLKEWLDRYDLDKWEREYIQVLCGGGSVPNHFLGSLFRQQSYVFHRHTCKPGIAEEESPNRHGPGAIRP
jgi:hypothetical protein